MNFFGGPGESSHKQFVKSPGLKTQRRVLEFASQVAKQYHHVMVSQHAYSRCIGALSNAEIEKQNEGEKIIMEGKYTINITGHGIVEKWKFEKTSRRTHSHP